MPICATSRRLRRRIYTFSPMVIAAASGNPQATMSLLLEDRRRRQADIAERWADDGEPDQLLVRCRALLSAADQLEQAASAARAPRVNPAVLGCLGEALSALATVSLLLSQTAGGGAEPEDADALNPRQLLFAISQNLRFASEAAGLGHQTLEGAP